MKKPECNLRVARGFSMIEVLVTLLIISLALLGTAGLQAYSMRMNQAGQFRTLAVFLVADLAERIEANKPAAVSGLYVVAESSAPVAANAVCLNGACDASTLAGFDLAQWQNIVSTRLPQSSWQVCVDANRDSVCDAGVVPSNPINYLIRISWVDRLTDKTDAASDASSSVGQNAAGTGERFFYSASRAIFN
jgi:type IV pilus assembly protein PilV